MPPLCSVVMLKLLGKSVCDNSMEPVSLNIYIIFYYIGVNLKWVAYYLIKIYIKIK